MTNPTRITVSPPVPAITTHTDGSAASDANPHVAKATPEAPAEQADEAKPARKGK